MHLKKSPSVIFAAIRVAFFAGIATSVSGSAKAAAANPCNEISNSQPAYGGKSKKFLGCRLGIINPESTYAKLGLKTGDLIHPQNEPKPTQH